MQQHEVGETASAGYQIGVRRTVPYAEAAVWAALLSPAGQQIWLGGVADITDGAAFRFENGTSGTLRVFTPGSHLRLSWQPAGWTRPSTLQVRVIPAKTGTTLSFHQEQLAGPAERAAMRERWELVITEITHLLDR